MKRTSVVADPLRQRRRHNTSQPAVAHHPSGSVQSHSQEHRRPPIHCHTASKTSPEALHRALRKLVLKVCGLLESLIVIRTRHRSIGCTKIDTANFRTEEARSAVSQY